MNAKTIEQLIDFGRFCLSEQRLSGIKDGNPNYGKEELKARMRVVRDFDIELWVLEQKAPIYLEDNDPLKKFGTYLLSELRIPPKDNILEHLDKHKIEKADVRAFKRFCGLLNI